MIWVKFMIHPELWRVAKVLSVPNKNDYVVIKGLSDKPMEPVRYRVEQVELRVDERPDESIVVLLYPA